MAPQASSTRDSTQRDGWWCGATIFGELPDKSNELLFQILGTPPSIYDLKDDKRNEIITHEASYRTDENSNSTILQPEIYSCRNTDSSANNKPNRPRAFEFLD